MNRSANAKKVEQKLKDSQDHLSAAANRLSQLISNLHNGILLEDEERNVVLTNRLFCNMFHIPVLPGELKGSNCKNSAEQSKYLFKNPAKYVARINVLLQNRELAVGDELEMRDGRTLRRDYLPVYVATEYKGHLWKYDDITSEKDSENELERLSLVAGANKNGVVFCDAAGVIDWANEGFASLTRYNLDEVIGRKAVELCIGPLSDLGTIKKCWRLFMAAGVLI